MTPAFLQQAKLNLTQLFYSSGHDKKLFHDNVLILAKYHSKNEHTFCTFHKSTVCSCGQCSGEDDFVCATKPYRSHHYLTCPYHQLMYEIDCIEQIALMFKSLIHPTLGQLRTNATESCFNTLTRFRNKSSHLRCMHYEVSTNLGLIHSNLTRLINVDSNYNWYFELYVGLKLPVYCGMREFLLLENIARLKKTEYIKTELCKRKRNIWKTKHRTIEQVERKKSSKKRKVCHTYGIASDEDRE